MNDLINIKVIQKDFNGEKKRFVNARELRGWVEKGLLEKIGKAKKDSYYRKPGQEVPRGLFSRGVDNKVGKNDLLS